MPATPLLLSSTYDTTEGTNNTTVVLTMPSGLVLLWGKVWKAPDGQ